MEVLRGLLEKLSRRVSMDKSDGGGHRDQLEKFSV